MVNQNFAAHRGTIHRALFLQISPSVSSSTCFGHKNHFRRMIPQWRTVKVPIHRTRPKSASRQQVLHLISEEIPQRPGKNQALFFSGPIRHIKNHLYIIPLQSTVKRRHPFHDSHAPSVRHRIFRHQPFLPIRRIMHSFCIRLKHIQNQPPASLSKSPAS